MTRSIQKYNIYILILISSYGVAEIKDNKTEKLLKISKKDAYRQYLAYHEGWGNYKNYKNNQKVIILAKKVAEQANDYRKQLNKCKKKLNRNKYIIF